MRSALERYFEFARLETNWRTEILAGLTTFVTMAYIIFVNPSILSETGMPFAAVTAATCLAAALGCFLMGALARYPVALAPGMGLNAYFTFAVVKGMDVPWPAALGAVFISGILFLILTAAGVRQMIVEAIPRELYAAVAVGIGLFIAFIGFRNAGLCKRCHKCLVHCPRIWGRADNQAVEYARNVQISKNRRNTLVKWQFVNNLRNSVKDLGRGFHQRRGAKLRGINGLPLPFFSKTFVL